MKPTSRVSDNKLYGGKFFAYVISVRWFGTQITFWFNDLTSSSKKQLIIQYFSFFNLQNDTTIYFSNQNPVTLSVFTIWI